MGWEGGRLTEGGREGGSEKISLALHLPCRHLAINLA